MEQINKLTSFLVQHKSDLLLSLAILSFFLILRLVFLRLIKNQARKNNISFDREIYMRKLFNVLMLLLLITSIGAIWEISLKGLSLYFASILTIVGVALFATWSVLSRASSDCRNPLIYSEKESNLG